MFLMVLCSSKAMSPMGWWSDCSILVRCMARLVAWCILECVPVVRRMVLEQSSSIVVSRTLCFWKCLVMRCWSREVAFHSMSLSRSPGR